MAILWRRRTLLADLVELNDLNMLVDNRQRLIGCNLARPGVGSHHVFVSRTPSFLTNSVRSLIVRSSYMASFDVMKVLSSASADLVASHSTPRVLEVD